MLEFLTKRNAIVFIVLCLLLGEVKAKEDTYVHSLALDSPEIDLFYPIYDPLDPTNFSQGLIDFNLPLNINNNVQFDPTTGQYIYNSLLGDSLRFRPSRSFFKGLHGYQA